MSELLTLEGILPPVVDSDGQSKATDSTTGSPDLSVQGRQSRLLHPPNSHPPTDEVSSGSSHHGGLSRSPFARFFRRSTGSSNSSSTTHFHPRSGRGGHHNPHNASHEGKAHITILHPPSCVVVEQPSLAGRGPPHRGGEGRGVEGTTTSIPVKATSRQGSFNAENDDEHESAHLQQLYDLRTWDMYLRITEARKKQNKVAAAGAAIAPMTGHNNNNNAQAYDPASASAAGRNDDPSSPSYEDPNDCYGWFDDDGTVSPNTAVYPSPHHHHQQQQQQYYVPTVHHQYQYQHQYPSQTPFVMSAPTMPLPFSSAAAAAPSSSHELIFGDLDL